MPDIITRNVSPVEQNWQQELANAISSPAILLEQLEIHDVNLVQAMAAKDLFAQRVPQSFMARMEKGNPNDPLLRQVLPISDEFLQVDGFTTDPLDEQDTVRPGLLHKYKSRVLMIVKGGCAVNCRYCFRRHFPYQDHQGQKRVWRKALDYIVEHPEIEEVILSGGDPLMAKDHELAWLIHEISLIAHIRMLRIHTRLPVVIPNRITSDLLAAFQQTRLQVVMVTHINHPNEIDANLIAAMQRLKVAGVTLLNQSVLLSGVNDDVQILKRLSIQLFTAGILPYYLHLLDKVAGASHFWVDDDTAKQLLRELTRELSGYLVPRLMREEAGKPSKTPIDLHLS